MFRPCLTATSLILAAGPTRIALMIPASADSIAPRKELSSQGWTTTVVTVGTPLGAVIRRSYFDPGCFALASAGMTLIVSLRIPAAEPMTLSPLDRKEPHGPDRRARTARRPASDASIPRRISPHSPTAPPGQPRTPCGVGPRCQAAVLE